MITAEIKIVGLRAVLSTQPTSFLSLFGLLKSLHESAIVFYR